MNERIEELSNQAYDYASAKNSIYSPQLLRDYTEKFAELIVRECAMLVDSKTEYSYGVANSWCQGKDVLEHFGVEE